MNVMNEIKGIKCEVKNCVFHDQADCCNAGHITVGSKMAKNVCDTKCETFRCNDNCNCM